MSFDIEEVEHKVKHLFQGHGKKKWLIIGGVVAVVAIVALMKRKKAAASDNSVYTSGYPTLPDYGAVSGSDSGGATGSGITADDLALLRDNLTQQITDTSTNLGNALNTGLSTASQGWADTFNTFTGQTNDRLDALEQHDTPDTTAAGAGATSTYHAGEGATKTASVETAGHEYYVDPSNGNVFKDDKYVAVTDSNKKYLPAEVVAASHDAHVANTAAKPAAAASAPAKITEGSNVYSTDASGNIYKNNVYVPASNYGYIPDSVKQQAAAAKQKK